MNLAIEISDIPREWKQANIILIPKPKDWRMNVDITRPITLLETARKLFTKILTNRIESSTREHNTLRGNNCSVLKGTSTDVPIKTLLNLGADAKESLDKELWIVLQDMKKAYDSVGWESLKRSLIRIKMNNKYIQLLDNIHNNRQSRIITDHGLTEQYHVEDGIDQGETHAPILWRIFYDPLLCAVKDKLAQTSYRINREDNTQGAVLKADINHLAFVDDTAWIANSRENMESILSLAETFFQINDIQINKNKTEALVIRGRKKANESLGSVKFGEDSHSRL